MDDRAFSTWVRVFAGAVGFAFLFLLLHMLAGHVLHGIIEPGRDSYLLAGLAFWGYLLVAIWIRGNPVPPDR